MKWWTSDTSEQENIENGPQNTLPLRRSQRSGLFESLGEVCEDVDLSDSRELREIKCDIAFGNYIVVILNWYWI